MGQSSSSREPTMEDKVRKFGVFDNKTHQLHFDFLSRCRIHSGSVIDWLFLANHGLYRGFFERINTDHFFGPQWVNLFQINELVYQELVREFVDSIEFDATACSTRSGLRRTVTVKAENLLMEFWPTIGDGEFVVGGRSVKKVRDPRVRDKDLICGSMFVTKLARSFGILTRELMDALSVKPRAHIFKKKILDYYRDYLGAQLRACYWPATRHVGEDDEAEEAAEEGAGGSSNVYQNISRGNWQVHQVQWMDAG
ncbi:hypothetical protein Tco_1354087 [Tanacetum coccineum]